MRSKRKVWPLFALALIGCLLIAGCPDGSSTTPPEPVKEPEGFVRVGAVAFGSEILGTQALSDDLAGVKKFLADQAQDTGGTVLCYAVSEAVKLLPEDLSDPDAEFAETYIITLTDGRDNASSRLYSQDAEADVVPTAAVYTRAKADLDGKVESANLSSYVIGFSQIPNQPLAAADDLKELVVGGGEYTAFSNTAQLTRIAESIGNRALVSAKSYVISTIDAVYTEAQPRYLSITVKAKPSFNGLKSQEVAGYLKAQLVRPGTTEDDVPVFTIIEADQFNYLSLDVEDIEPVVNTKNQIEIPLTGLRFVKDGVPYVISEVTVKVSDDGENFISDPEDASVSEETLLDKRIGVILVVDYSQSLSDKTFEAVKKAAGDFIETLSKVNASVD
jgi:uncharacterized protein YegL